MKSMKQMQNEQLGKCWKQDGWPKPFVHFGGAVEVCKNQEQMDKALMSELLALAIAIPAAVLLILFLLP